MVHGMTLSVAEAYIEAKRWHELMGVAPSDLEEIIAQHFDYSFIYAYHVLKRRFELGEEKMKLYPDYWESYCQKFDIT